MTFRGSLANVNAALDGLRFLSEPGYLGVASLEFINNDQGNTGSGVALGDTDMVAIDIQPAPPPPPPPPPSPPITPRVLSAALVKKGG